MRTSLLLTSCLTLLTTSLFGQAKKLKLNEDKYSINLPDYWGKGHKVWKTLADRLPLACEELKDKELCGDDCNPKYTVELYLTEPANYEYSYRKIEPNPFTSTRHLGSNIQERGIDPGMYYNPERAYYSRNSNNWEITTTYDFQGYLLLLDNNDKVIVKMVLVDTNEVWKLSQAFNMTGVNFTATTPQNYVQEHKEKFLPTLYNLLAIIEDKILSL
jgi:hypothetical protein